MIMENIKIKYSSELLVYKYCLSFYSILEKTPKEKEGEEELETYMQNKIFISPIGTVMLSSKSLIWKYICHHFLTSCMAMTNAILLLS